MPAQKKNAASQGVRDFYIHLVSDATGGTLQGLARAALAQFDNIHPIERFWPLVRSEAQLGRVLADLGEHPGPVLFTMVDPHMRRLLKKRCADLGVPCMPVLDPVIRGLSSYLGRPSKGIPGLQHALDEAYFERIDAVDFAMSFDDGQNFEGIEDADVILVGVSRTSKTPTCIFLARRGIRAANIPLVPGNTVPDWILALKEPMFVGLTESTDRLVALRRTRLHADHGQPPPAHVRDNAYMDPELVEEEVRAARRLFSRMGWPVIDVTRRSIEETAAEIMILLQKRQEERGKT